MEKQLSRKEIYSGKVIKVVVDDIEMDKGVKAKREVVLHNGGACVAIKDKDGKYIMVRQWRYPFSTELIEFCAGKIELNEDPDVTVIREAKEEAGCVLKNIRKFGYIVPTCGYSSEKIYLYYGEVDQKCDQEFDYDEDVKLIKLSYEEIKEKILKGEIYDGKTVSLAYYLKESGLEH